MKILFFILFIITPFYAAAYEVKSENGSTDEVINARMKIMSNINNLSQKIYKQLASEDFESLEETTLELKHLAMDFTGLFPLNSKGGNAKILIWENMELFEEYNNNFLDDINLMLSNINKKNITLLKKSFNNMASNCGSCHKKFKNKK
jgi:cytochrome c556